MKNTTKTIAAVLAVFLAAALFVGAASAAEARPVGIGQTAFVYENITVGTHGDGYLNFYDKDDVFVTSINATNGGFNLLDVAVGSNTGIWYWSSAQGGAKGTTTVNIQYPSLSLDLRSGISSMDGKSVVRGQEELTFVINAPYMTEDLGKQANVSIVVTTPEGGKFNGIFNTSKSGKDLTNFNLTGVQTLINGVSVPTTAQAGTYVIYAEFVLNNSGLFKKGTAMKDQYKKSASITVTVGTSDLDISIDKASVIRSNPFLVTISGEAQKTYALVVEDGYSTTSGIFIPDNQTKVTNPPVGAASFNWFKNVTTDSSRKAVVQFDTTTDTDDKSYTIKVYGINVTDPAKPTLESGNYASASIKVEKGSVTASAPGDLIYYLGNEVDITGTNSDSQYVQIYYDGPNIPWEYLDYASVKEDNSWEFKFDTSDMFNSKDGASYTFYFVGTNDKYSDATKITGSDALTDYEYATLSMTFKKPFVSATTSASVVASGDDITISGTAEGKPPSVAYYIFGTNFYESGTISVDDDSTFEKKITIKKTQDAGQYYVVVEHPMENGVFDVHQAYLSEDTHYYNSKKSAEENGGYVSTYLFIPQAAYFGKSTFNDDIDAGEFGGYVSELDLAFRTSQSSFIVDGSGKLQSSQAADTLGKIINDANIDDTYVKLTFNVVAPKITIDAIADQAAGSTFTISGTTNMAVDGEVLVQIQSSAFDALDKSQQAGNSGYTQTAKIVAGDGVDNVWSIEVDSTNWELDEYNVKAEVIGKSVSDTAKFNLVEKTVTPTATATGATPTTTATATATTAPTQTPGFGAFVALAGLGAVALLVLRRN